MGETMAKSKEFPQYNFVKPRSYTGGRKSGQPTVIFIHTTEGGEGRTSAEDGAAYDARRDDGTSTHFFVDQDTTIQCVLTTDEAHAARSHGNDVGIQIEVCGKAGQSAAQWADAASAGALEQAARLAVALRKQRPGRFPLVNLTPQQLRAGQHGFAEHYDATRAWPEDNGSHSDPGPNFPWARLFARITELETLPVAELEIADSNDNINTIYKGVNKPGTLTKYTAGDVAPYSVAYEPAAHGIAGGVSLTQGRVELVLREVWRLRDELRTTLADLHELIDTRLPGITDPAQPLGKPDAKDANT
jgi:N-acetyl-anhydromuramyl-L-alanine amidase AmpD